MLLCLKDVIIESRYKCNMDELLRKIKDTTEFLNNLDEIQENARKNISQFDSMQQDLLHYLENNSLKSFELIRLMSELKRVRNLRRDSKNIFEIIIVFKKNMLQLQNSKGRDIILNAIKRKQKDLKIYNNRFYKKDELEKIIRGDVNEKNITTNTNAGECL